MKDERLINLAENVKNLRDSKGLSQAALAEEIKAPQSLICRIENISNKSMPRTDSLLKLADFFGCSVDYLLKNHG